MKNRKIIGLIAFCMAVGMVFTVVVHDRLAELIIIALLLVLGYLCFSDC